MQKNIAIIAGGDSGEYEVSINSGKVVRKFLNKEKYKAFLIVIIGDQWYFQDEEGKNYNINRHDFSLSLQGTIIKFDAVFNVIHGTPGENGIIQAYFDLLDIPYTTSDLMTSSLTFNKDYCKRVVSTYGYRMASSVHLTKSDKYNVEEIYNTLNLPVFVKPNSGGSSLATTKVKLIEEMESAIQLAFKEDNEVLIEEFIDGREVDCGVFNFKGKMMAFPTTEIITDNEFFDYEAKYTPGVADEITPAEIPENIDIEIKAISVDLYTKLNCKGLVRFDYIFNDKGIWFLEVNTIPGLSEQSIVPQQANVFGLSTGELFDMMIENILVK